jgi:hypothetical protein
MEYAIRLTAFQGAIGTRQENPIVRARRRTLPICALAMFRFGHSREVKFFDRVLIADGEKDFAPNWNIIKSIR